MSVFGLSGDAAIPLVLGNLLNIYAAIGSILTLDLTVKEVFMIALDALVFTVCCWKWSCRKSGVKLWIVLVVRYGLAIISAIVINLVWQGGSEPAQFGFVSNELQQRSNGLDANH